MHLAWGSELRTGIGVAALFLASAVLASAQANLKPEVIVITPVQQDVSPALAHVPPRRDMRPRHERATR